MSKKILTPLVAIVSLFAAAAPAARADLMIRHRNSATPGYEETLYLKGSMQRRDIKGPQRDGRVAEWSWLEDCARQRFIWLDPVNRRYTVHEGGVPLAAFAAFNEPQFPPQAPKGMKGTLTETVAVTDTGERREMFGLAARRLKTFVTWSVAPDSCDTGQARIEIDGWYADLLYGIDCSPDLSGAIPRTLIDFADSRCLNKRLLGGKHLFRRAYTGGGRFGYPLSETTRSYGQRGQLVSTETREVLELSNAELDGALFSVPAGYTRVEPKIVGKPSALSRLLSIFR